MRLDGPTPDVHAVSAMADAMAPAAPTRPASGQGRVALGHRRLKIIDLSEAGGAAGGADRAAGAGRRPAPGGDRRRGGGRDPAYAAEVIGTGKHSVRELIEAQSRRRRRPPAVNPRSRSTTSPRGRSPSRLVVRRAPAGRTAPSVSLHREPAPGRHDSRRDRRGQFGTVLGGDHRGRSDRHSRYRNRPARPRRHRRRLRVH